MICGDNHLNYNNTLSNHKKWCDDLFQMQNESLWLLPALPDVQVIEDW